MQYIEFIVTIILILVIFWFANSQKKVQDKKIKEMQDKIKVDDKIITYSGISGKVCKVDNDRIIIKVNPSNNELSIEKWAIAGIDDRTVEKEQTNKK